MRPRIRTRHAYWLLSIVAVVALLTLAACSSDDDGDDPTSPDTTPPAPVTDFTAVPGDGQVTLAWSNPTGGDFTGTMLRRYPTGAPVDPAAGVLLYDGPAESFVDTGVSNDTGYAYAAFTHDQAGNQAEPVTISATPHAPVMVSFPDANLEQVMRGVTGVSSGDITDLDLFGITTLNAADHDIADVTGLQWCVDLEVLELGYNPIDETSNLDVLAALPGLRELDLSYTDLGDFTAIDDLIGLTNLELAGMTVADLSPLTSLTGLTHLGLAQTAVTDLSPLTGMANLIGLTIHMCDGITGFETLGTMTQLRELRAHDVATANLDPLSALTGLGILEIDHCLASDLDAIMGLDELVILSVYGLPLLAEAVNVQIPTLVARDVFVGWEAQIPVEVIGTWTASAVTMDGSPMDLADFFEWDPTTATARLYACCNADYGYAELDAGGEAVYEETGDLYVFENQLQVTVMTENGTDVQDYTAFDGTWQVSGDHLVLTAQEEGSTIVITWVR